MLTPAQIDAGDARLESGKLTAVDVSKLVSVFEMFFAGIANESDYDYKTKLEALDDTGNTAQNAAQVAGCIAIMEELGFGVARKDGDTKYSEKEEYAQYVIIAMSKIYPIPSEWSQYDLRRRRSGARASQTAANVRAETTFGGGFSEREQRRRYRRRVW